MKKRFLLVLVALSIGVANLSAVVMTKDAATAVEPSTIIDVLKQQQDVLELKAETTGLTKKEAKLQKKLDRKINKLEKRAAAVAGGDRSWLIALLLSLFLGGLAIDRFYLGYIGLGILKLLTIGGFGVWYLIDVILIIVRALKPKNGSYTD